MNIIKFDQQKTSLCCFYTNPDEYVAKENKTLQQYYEGFTTEYVAADTGNDDHKKTVILLRGTNGYNEYAIALKTLLSEQELKVAIVSTDANIAKVNEEVAQDNLTQDPKAGWKWPEVRTESYKRNFHIYQSVLDNSDVDVIIYADMKKLCHKFNLFMTRHLADFKSDKGQINAKSIKVGGKEILQYHDVSANNLF
ncbi:hypothetical protein [Legionella sainthelensi]|uniref:hypothetical protein n=1 Tax=Legionella sainthelensi TaxID=28087 RepID=UPI000E208888|nr:hypothetical protein [Legionella sainthelensi]